MKEVVKRLSCSVTAQSLVGVVGHPACITHSGSAILILRIIVWIFAWNVFPKILFNVPKNIINLYF